MASMNIKLNSVGVSVFAGLLVVICIYQFAPFSVSSPSQVDLKELMAVSLNLAEKGGQQVIKVKETERNTLSKGKTLEGANNPQTQADRNSNAVIVGGFEKVYGNKLTVKSEEKNTAQAISTPISLYDKEIFSKITDSNLKVPMSDVTVWVDPLDATQEYIDNLHEYVSTMICIAVKGVPKFGIIHFPYAQKPNQTYWGYVDSKVTSSNLNQEGNRKSSDKVFIISRSHRGKVENLIRQAYGSKTEVRNAGGAGYKVIQVITGNATVYAHLTRIKKWDICAGNAILNAVGGTMTTLKNQIINYSASDSPINEKGLLVSMKDHDEIYKKLTDTTKVK